MSVADSLKRLARGWRPADDRLLGTCRLAAGGVELVGEEAIVAYFRAHPLALGSDACIVTAAQSLAIFDRDGGAALIADLYDGHIGRLWRIGAPPAPAAPFVAVAFDPDLKQARGDLALEPGDHPELASGWQAPLAAAATALARDWRGDGPPPHRVRAFVLRAWSDDDSAAALLALATWGGGAVRDIGFDYAALRLGGDGRATVVREPPAADPVWSPRL